ncbi:hypothetical protein DKL61_11875 [Gammaproteobacteria bacterium ESL0073]|nr:hypothetical protein DKL61_11875 [Gammaproteobacteria bacterium ESL0073]
MQKLCIVFCLLSLGLLGCSNKETSENPYKESHIVSVAPNYVIEVNEKPKLTKEQINAMSEEALKTRFSELQNEELALTPGQKKEFDMIGERLKELSTTY